MAAIGNIELANTPLAAQGCSGPAVCAPGRRAASSFKSLLADSEKKHGKGKALSILAHKIGRAVYDMLARGTVFSMDTCRAA